LEASGSEREAKLARAILGEAHAPAPVEPAPAAPVIPTAAVLPADVAALAAEQTGPPSGLTRADLRTMTASEIAALPRKDVDGAMRGGG
jgi:hypothetical protein